MNSSPAVDYPPVQRNRFKLLYATDPIEVVQNLDHTRHNTGLNDCSGAGHEGRRQTDAVDSEATLSAAARSRP